MIDLIWRNKNKIKYTRIMINWQFHLQKTHTATFDMDIMNPKLACSQRQWLHSSVGRASHRYREVTGSSPVEVLNFFQASLRNCKNCDHNCEDHFQASLRNCKNCSYDRNFYNCVKKPEKNSGLQRGHGFKRRWSPEFFSGFFTQL